MRKLLICLAALAAVAIPAVAIAQNPAPEVSGSVKITPSKAGTTKKPKAAKFQFTVVNSPASKTTVKQVVLDLPKGVKFDGSKLDACSAKKLIAGSCKSSSKLGTGVAYAFVVTSAPAPDCVGTRGAAQGCLTFDTTLYAGGPKTVTVGLVNAGNALAPLTGKISKGGRRLTIDIRSDLQQPTPGSYSALSQLGGSFSPKTVKGKKQSLVTTTSCPSSKKWTVKSTLVYAPNPAKPPVASARSSADMSCKS